MKTLEDLLQWVTENTFNITSPDGFKHKVVDSDEIKAEINKLINSQNIKTMSIKTDLRLEYENRTGNRCRIIQKEINWESRKNMIVFCEITHGITSKTGTTFRTTETSFAREWKPVNQVKNNSI